MKSVIWLLLLFTLAVLLALFARENNGYALLFFNQWRMELSLNAFVLLFVFLLGGGYGLLKLLDWLVSMPGNVRQYQAARRASNAGKYHREALLAMFEGRHLRAERNLRVALASQDNPELRLADTLIAVRASHSCRDFERRDAYLAQAREIGGPRSLARLMLEAELLGEQYRTREALDLLHQVYAISPKLTSALKLELKLRQQENHPARVIELADMLERSEAIDAGQAFRVRAQARLAQLKLVPMDSRELERWWASLGKDERHQPRLAAAAAREFGRLALIERAETIVVEALESNWDVSLLEVYGELGRMDGKGDAVKRLARAEEWLRHHPNDHSLLLALGRLCRDAALWGKARTYLEASVAVTATPVAHAELGQLLEQLDEREEANEQYRASLGLALDLLERRG